jgi:hypothetical protein
MKTLTVTNPIVRVTSNKSKRHFTIYKTDGTKYRTLPMSKPEFESNEMNTMNDWRQFLKSDEYYVVK